MSRLRFLVAILGGLGLISACATTEESATDIRQTHYTLKLNRAIPYHQPLPARTDIQVTWHLSNNSSKNVNSYRGWDFDGDQRFEMVEVLAKTGAMQTRVYDFDGDGRIDLIQ